MPMKSSKRVKYYEVHVSLEIFQKKEMPNQFRKYSIRFNAKCNSFTVNKCTANRMNFVDEYVAGFCSKVLARPCMKIEHNLRNRYGISIMPITPNDQYINSCWLSMIIRNIHCSAAPTQCSAMDFRNKHSVHAFHLSTIHFDVATHGPCCVHCSPIAQIICLTLMHTKCRIYSKSVLLR